MNKYRNRLHLILISFLIIASSGCGPQTKQYKVHIKINSNGKVSYEFIFFDIGCKISENSAEEFESLKNEYIEGTGFEDWLKKECSNIELKMKKFWIDDASLNAIFLFEIPDLESFLNSANKIGFVKLDENGNFYFSVNLKDSEIKETNGRVNKISTKLSSISWPSESKEMYYCVSDKGDYQIKSFSELFFLKYGPSKTILHHTCPK